MKYLLSTNRRKKIYEEKQSFNQYEEEREKRRKEKQRNESEGMAMKAVDSNDNVNLAMANDLCPVRRRGRKAPNSLYCPPSILSQWEGGGEGREEERRQARHNSRMKNKNNQAAAWRGVNNSNISSLT